MVDDGFIAVFNSNMSDRSQKNSDENQSTGKKVGTECGRNQLERLLHNGFLQTRQNKSDMFDAVLNRVLLSEPLLTRQNFKDRNS